MTARRFQTISRFIVMVLLLNIASSVVAASTSIESNYAWLCTSQGLVKVALSPNSDDASERDNSGQINHCPYCKFADQSVDLADSHLAYPQPSALVSIAYTPPTNSRALNATLSEIRLRAPPISPLI